MNRHLTLKQYRNLDLFFFAVMLILSETLTVSAGIRWYPDQLYTVSVSAAITAIVMMRWGPWAAIHAVLGGIVYCLAAKGTPRQFVIYGAGNLFALLSLLMIRLMGNERIRGNVIWVLRDTQEFLAAGRGVWAPQETHVQNTSMMSGL